MDGNYHNNEKVSVAQHKKTKEGKLLERFTEFIHLTGGTEVSLKVNQNSKTENVECLF